MIWQMDLGNSIMLMVLVMRVNGSMINRKGMELKNVQVIYKSKIDGSQYSGQFK